jgi:DNA-binding IscR family transcriptional regulator
MRDYERRQAPQRADAEQFIIDFLNNGKKTTAELDESAEAAGISKNTLSRAKTELRKKKILGSKAEGFGNSKVFYSYLLSTSH